MEAFVFGADATVRERSVTRRPDECGRHLGISRHVPTTATMYAPHRRRRWQLRWMEKRMKILNRFSSIGLLAALLAVWATQAGATLTAAEIDAGVNAAMDRLHADVK